jgi:hypothetical protein
VMDNLFDSDCAVDAGNGVRLHDGWVYSHLAGIGGRGCGDSVDQSASSHLRRLFDGCALSGMYREPHCPERTATSRSQRTGTRFPANSKGK